MASLTAIVAIVVMLVIAITAPIALIIWQSSYDAINSEATRRSLGDT